MTLRRTKWDPIVCPAEPGVGVGGQWERVVAESRLWVQVLAGLGKGATSWVGLSLPGFGRPSTKSPANFLCPASHSPTFLAGMAIPPPTPTPTMEMAGRRGVLQSGNPCQCGNLEAHGPLSCHPVARAQAKARSPGWVWFHVAVMREAWTLASDLGLCASSTAYQLCDLGDNNSLIGS